MNPINSFTSMQRMPDFAAANKSRKVETVSAAQATDNRDQKNRDVDQNKSNSPALSPDKRKIDDTANETVQANVQQPIQPSKQSRETLDASQVEASKDSNNKDDPDIKVSRATREYNETASLANQDSNRAPGQVLHIIA